MTQVSDELLRALASRDRETDRDLVLIAEELLARRGLTPQRYRLVIAMGCAQLLPDPNGDWVRFADLPAGPAS